MHVRVVTAGGPRLAKAWGLYHQIGVTRNVMKALRPLLGPGVITVMPAPAARHPPS
jgi:hypothetical protein